MLELIKMMLGIKTYWHPDTRAHVRAKLQEMLESDMQRYQTAAVFLDDGQYADLIKSATDLAAAFKQYEQVFTAAGDTLIAQTTPSE